MHGFGERACAQSTIQGSRAAPHPPVRAPDFSDDFVAANDERRPWDLSRFRGRAKVPAYTLHEDRAGRFSSRFKNEEAMILPAIPSSVGTLLLTACLIASMGAAENVVYRNTVPGVAYTGSSACAGRHPKIWRAFNRHREKLRKPLI